MCCWGQLARPLEDLQLLEARRNPMPCGALPASSAASTSLSALSVTLRGLCKNLSSPTQPFIIHGQPSGRYKGKAAGRVCVSLDAHTEEHTLPVRT
jgi:hypothetical protein